MKHLLFIGLLLLSLLAGDALAGVPGLPSLAVEKAKEMSWVRERTNHNDHPVIDEMLRYQGLPPGLSWCLAFVVYSYKLAADDLHVKNPLPKMARCATFWQYAQDNEFRYVTFTREDVAFGIHKLKMGDVGIFSHNKGTDQNWNGHAVLVIAQEGHSFRTIEGNTTPGPEGNQREGGGVYERTRGLGPGLFQVEGFVRIREGR